MKASRLPKRALVLASFAPSLLNFRGPLLRDLRKAGHEVSVGAPDIDPALRSELEAFGVTVHETPMQRNRVGVFADLRYHRTLLRLMRQVRPDIVLTYTIKPNIWGALAARRAGVPSVSLVTGLGFAFSSARSAPGLKDRAVGFLARTLYRLAARCNQKVIFQNPDDLDDFVASGCLADRSKAALVNGSGVDLEHYARAECVTAPVFLMISRLLASKGVREYVEAARLVRARHPEARCLLVGPHDGGPDAIETDRIEEWQASGSVEYLGSAVDVRPLIAQSAVYVLPSHREGTPRSVLEAMAMGRPIVTTDAPGCRQTVIDGENGFLVPVRDGAALAEAMQRFIDDPSLIASMGQRSHEIALETYDVHKVNAAMLSIMGLE